LKFELQLLCEKSFNSQKKREKDLTELY